MAEAKRETGGALRLVHSSTKPDSKPRERQEPSFIKKLIHHHDAEAAADLVAEQAGLDWDREHGAELRAAIEARADIEPRHKRSESRLTRLEKKLEATPEFIRSARAQTGEDVHRVAFSEWSGRDRFLMVLTVGLCALACFTGGANVYSNLMSSGNIVFLEDPWLAVTLSTLLPIGAISVKFATNFMEFDRSRRLYAQGIFALTVISLLAWTVLFSMNFTGVSAEFDINSLTEPAPGSGPALVWTQLATEMLAASSLFLAAEHIYVKYAADYYTQNIDHIEIKRAYDEHLKAHEGVAKKRADLYALVDRLTAARQSFINEAVAEFIYLSGRVRAARDIS